MQSNKLSPSLKNKSRKPLRRGFSTGTAVTAAARAALRHLLTGKSPSVVAVRLPAGFFLPVTVEESQMRDGEAWASVIKDGGDDPDVTHKAELRARVKLFEKASEGEGLAPNGPQSFAGEICLIAGTGVGIATKPGLPVKVGEPAVNPVPRKMLALNLAEEFEHCMRKRASRLWKAGEFAEPSKPHVKFPLGEFRFAMSAMACKDGLHHVPGNFSNPVPGFQGDSLHSDFILEVEIEVPRGEELARHTLNPRLGVLGGISILGTTGIVKPFSHKAYEETIQVELSVAASNGCGEVALSTGGKSEHYARGILQWLPPEAFVQIADFFSFAVREAARMGFKGIIHSVFFGKALKMAQGHPYTHAHKVALDLAPLAGLASELGYKNDFCDELASANTARHALEYLLGHGATDIIEAVAEQALRESKRIAEGRLSVRLLLFDFDGVLLADLK